MLPSKAYLESRILSADPVELIAILYEQAIISVQEARAHLAKKDIAARARQISRAIVIIGELDASLDHSIGGEMTLNLARLYQYMRERLTAANIQQTDAPLAEVESLLNTLAESWDGVKRATAQPAPAAAAPLPNVKTAQFATPFFVEPEAHQYANSWTA